jgi:hypothetical protein
MKLKLRKKLTTTIIGLVVNWLAVFLASKGLDLTPESQQTLIEAGLVISGLIVSFFNIGQGIADKGKESNNGS